MSHSLLEIHLLGPIEIKYEDEPLQIRRRIERTLLYILAVEHKPISRTTLIDMLWPEADQTDPRGALRTALSRLRNELPEPDLILTELDQVWLDINRTEIDLINFESYYQSLQRSLTPYQENRPLPAQLFNQIKEALALWHGSTLLEGDNLDIYSEVEHWRQMQNMKLTHQRKFLMGRLAKHYQAAGHLENALDLFFQLGQMDLLNVPIHLSIIKLLTNLGRHEEAVDYCDTLEKLYERNYNAPLPESILEYCHSLEAQITTDKKAPEKHWPIPLTMYLQLIGREAELNQLQDAFLRGGMAVIQGELGTGKTRLVQELFQTLDPQPTLLIAPSQEMENALPFSPIIHCMRRHVPNETWKEIDTVWANQLSLLFPELSEIRTDCNPSNRLNLSSGKQPIFDALHHILSLVARQSGRLLFFLDDAQWADKQTLEALSYLMAQDFFVKHGLLILAARPEEQNRYLEEMIGQFHRTQSLEIITLDGLSSKELRILAQQALDKTPSEFFINKLHRETNGNPFMAIEVIRTILDRQVDLENLTASSNLPLPASVHALIRRRLNRLGENERHILLCGAVLGNAFSLKTLLSVAHVSSDANLEILTPLIKSGFLHVTDETNPLLANLHFPHDKLQEVVLREATPVQLQILHRQAADHLVTREQASANAAVIANHYLAGGEIKEAFNWYLQAAAYDWSLGTREETLKAYRQAESLLENAPEHYFTIDDVLHLYQQWSEFAYQSNQIDMLEETGIKLQYHGGSENHPLLLGVSQLALANACLLRTKIPSGLNLIEKSIKYLQIANNQKVLTEAFLRQGILYYWNENYEGTLKSSENMMTICNTLPTEGSYQVSYEFGAKHMAAMAYYAQGNARKALNIANEIYANYYHRLDRFSRTRSLYVLAYANLISGKYQESEQFVREALKITRALDNSFMEEILLVILSKAEVIQGYLDSAYAHASRALKLGEINQNEFTTVAANSVMGDIYFALRNYAHAIQYYRMAQVREGMTSSSLHGMRNNVRLARTLVHINQTQEAKEIILATLDITERTGMWQLYTQALLVSGICCVNERNLPTAEHKFSKAGNLADEKGLPYEKVWSKIGWAQLAMAWHQWDHAEGIIKEVIGDSLNLNMTWHALDGIKLYAQLSKLDNQRTAFEEYLPTFNTLINHAEKHCQTEPLRQDFHNAKQYWQEKIQQS